MGSEMCIRDSTPPVRGHAATAERRSRGAPPASVSPVAGRRPTNAAAFALARSPPSPCSDASSARCSSIGSSSQSEGAAPIATADGRGVRRARVGGRVGAVGTREPTLSSSRTARLERRCAKLEWQLSNALSHAEAFRELLAAHGSPQRAAHAGPGAGPGALVSGGARPAAARLPASPAQRQSASRRAHAEALSPALRLGALTLGVSNVRLAARAGACRTARSGCGGEERLWQS